MFVTLKQTEEIDHDRQYKIIRLEEKDKEKRLTGKGAQIMKPPALPHLIPSPPHPNRTTNHLTYYCKKCEYGVMI